MTGIELIAAERARQMAVEGWTAAHDAEHDRGELAIAAVCYASPEPLKALRSVPCSCREVHCQHLFSTVDKWLDPWPWAPEWDKRNKHDRIRQLAIAGALIAAEIDRLTAAGG